MEREGSSTPCAPRQSRISNPFIHVLVRLSDPQSLRARRE
jgi:hypothetical protein